MLHLSAYLKQPIDNTFQSAPVPVFREDEVQQRSF